MKNEASNEFKESPEILKSSRIEENRKLHRRTFEMFEEKFNLPFFYITKNFKYSSKNLE